jgi:hypothetical protein
VERKKIGHVQKYGESENGQEGYEEGEEENDGGYVEENEERQEGYGEEEKG